MVINKIVLAFYKCFKKQLQNVTYVCYMSYVSYMRFFYESLKIA